MAQIIGGIGTSHVPTIGVAYDKKKQNEAAWAPLFKGYEPIAAWLREKRPDVLVIFYNDHATRFFFDLYPTFAIGVADRFDLADEGSGRRALPGIPGHPHLASHMLESLIDDEFDMALFQAGAVDHGCHSPLPLMWPHDPDWPGAIVPIAINVLQFPLPTARRCYRLGIAVRKAVESYAPNLKVAVVGTGGLSHQVHGERTGFNNTPWDREFLSLLVDDPLRLTRLTHADYVRRGGAESVEMIMWLAMRGALGDKVRSLHENYYLATTTAMTVALYEPVGPSAPPASASSPPMVRQSSGIEDIPGTYLFDTMTSFRALTLNRFLWGLTTPHARQALAEDPTRTVKTAGLSESEQRLVLNHDWIGLIRYGASFFLLEKLARFYGISNLQVYASMRGEDLETFMQTRQVPDAR